MPAFGQQEEVTFSEALSLHLPKYKVRADKAYRLEQVQRANFLFDSLVNHCLKGSRFDNFQLKNLDDDLVALDEFTQPIFLMTSASWIIPSEGEIPALNKLVEKYHGQIDFVLLFWDTRETAEKIAAQYSEHIRILYVDELQNSSPYIIRKMKHSLGVPTSFLLDKDMKIVDIRRKISHPYGIGFEKSFSLNYEAFSKGISALLIDGSTQFSTAQEEVSPP